MNVRLIDVVAALEKRGRAAEAKRLLFNTARELAYRGIGLAAALGMDVDAVEQALKEPITLGGWDETSWGSGFECEGDASTR